MTNEGTAGIWWADTIRTDRALIALAMLVGLLLGSTLTALAMDRILDAGTESVVVAKQWPAHAPSPWWWRSSGRPTHSTANGGARARRSTSTGCSATPWSANPFDFARLP